MRSTPSPRRHLLSAGLALGLAALTAPQGALAADEKYPSRPITLVVPFPPGGSVDIMARQYSEPLSKVLGVPIVVENRAGAGGSVGAQYVARAKADGYTLVVSSQSSHLANPLTQPKVGYDPVKDFENIAILGRQPNALVVHSSLPFKTFAEFVDYAKKNPGKLNYGSGGVGSMGQLNVEMFKAATGAFTTHIPYRGGTPRITAVLGNEVQFIQDNLVNKQTHIQARKVRALAVTADH
ncbi:tripartite tricarboxylate transporter substrate-binding protein, partial [Acidovorax sp.]|uniref:Bug family tripartite tricarboxylate transporter substrate binding protein n=1 Tax=Acidovorax sp. TaxID=1872122 RepID=UPI0025BBA041